MITADIFSRLVENLGAYATDDIAWAAGLIEAEGCFVDRLIWQKGKQYPFRQIQVTSTDRDVIERLHRTMQSGNVYFQRSRDVSRKDAWRWCVSRSADVSTILTVIAPFLGERRRGKVAAMLFGLGQEIPAPITPQRLDTIEIAWAAGLIEGEAYIGRMISPGEKGKPYWRLRVTMTDLDVLKRLQAVFGFGGIFDHSQATATRKQSWTYIVARQNDLYAAYAARYRFMGLRRRAAMHAALVEMSARGPWRQAVRPPVKSLQPDKRTRKVVGEDRDNGGRNPGGLCEIQDASACPDAQEQSR